MSGNSLKKEFGDYQTPIMFAKEVCRYLNNELNISPEIIIEPTVGVGNFVSASLETFGSCEAIYGIEINSEYCDKCRTDNEDERVTIFNANFFEYDITPLVSKKETLIIGNPPWATNSELNFNLPEKLNFKRLSGTDAITGASNFDICEYIILKLIEDFKNTNTTIAMLCKTSVARNVLIELNRTNTLVEYVKILNFNSAKIFNISAAACLLVIKLSEEFNNANLCEVSDFTKPQEILSCIKCMNGVLTSQVGDVVDLEGTCQLEWRQGVKHDCSSVMELEKVDGSKYKNKRKEIVELEENLVFPLLKSSNFKSHLIKDSFSKYVIVTQKKVREDTTYIKELAPQTWEYLNKNRELFAKRKSSIYIGAPEYSMFGVGEYSYSKYKVGVSGFYKKPVFSLLYNESNIEHPVMLDDTTYFLSFDNYDNAYTCMLLLNSKVVQEFLYSISFQDAKRPYTKKVLQRLDIIKTIDNITYKDLKITESQLGFKEYVTEEMLAEFIQLLK